MSNRKTLFIIFTALWLLVYPNGAIGQERIETIGEREYLLVDSRWVFINQEEDTVRFSPERIIVRFTDSMTDIQEAKQTLNITDVDIASGPSRGGFYVFHISTVDRGFEVMRKLSEHSLVESVSFSIYGERLTTPNDPHYSDQWNLPKISMPSAWDITRGNPDVLLGIIDSGARLDHDDLENSIWSEVGYNFLNPGTDPTDFDGHGTAVAGIAGAETNNNEGVAGIAGPWSSSTGARLMILKDGDAIPQIELTSEAIEWAADNGAYVVNLSTGFPESHENLDMLESAVNYAFGEGVVIVASAGNNGGQGSSDKSIRYPARYSNTIAVGATLEDDTRWETSGYSGSAIGPELDIMAPGGAPIIWTTHLNGGYYKFGGTSASAPHVAGTVALMKSINPELSPSQIRNHIHNSADKTSGMGSQNFTEEYGYGRLNVLQAIENIFQITGPIQVCGPTEYAISELPNDNDINVSWSWSPQSALVSTTGCDEGEHGLCVMDNEPSNNVTITASISHNDWEEDIIITKDNIKAGTPTPIIYGPIVNGQGKLQLCIGEVAHFYATNPPPDVDEYHWTVHGGEFPIFLGNQQTSGPFFASEQGLYYVEAKQNMPECGWSNYSTKSFSVVDCGMMVFNVYPNPARSTLNIEATTESASHRDTFDENTTYQVKLYNWDAHLMRTSGFTLQESPHQVDISPLTKGKYILHITGDGELLHKEQVVIE